MVRSFAQWTKTLSFPSSLSSNRNDRDFTNLSRTNGVSKPQALLKNENLDCQISHLPSKEILSTLSNAPCTSNYSNVPVTELENIIYPENDKKRIIMGSLVYCIHHKSGCNWSDELSKLKGHLNVCKYDATQCPNICGSLISRIMMTDHLQYTCSLRRTKCEFCKSEFSGAELEQHRGKCDQEPIYCEEKCGQRVLRSRMLMHKVKDCNKRLRYCPHCSSGFYSDTLSAHVTQCLQTPIKCLNCDGENFKRLDMETHLRNDCKGLNISCSFKGAGCFFKGPRTLLETHLESNSAAHLSLMVALAARQSQQIQLLKSAISKLSTNCTGTLLWKITEWSKKMYEARNKNGLELVSPPFCTSQYGYKLQASMFLNGNGPGENTHVSVYMKLLPGDYDTLLKWPFSHSITFTLFEQDVESGQGGIAESFVPDPNWENFQRPSIQPDELGFGFPRFVSHKLLHTRKFIKDDTVFLRVKVDPSKIVCV